MTADNRCGKITADKEKQRAVSREAARIRRKAESDVLSDLSRLLPLPAAVRAHLDKPSVMRLTISYMQTRSLLSGIGGTLTKTQHAAKHRPLPGRGQEGDNVERSSQRWEEEEGETKEKEENSRVEEQEEEEATKEKKRRVEEKEEWRGPLWQREETDVYLRVLEGFVLAVSPDGDMICMSANVTKYLGLTQAELMGHNIYEFTHPCDHDEIRTNLRLTAAQCAGLGDHCVGSERTFIMRMKSTITHRGRATNLKSATWKVFLCRGRVKVCMAPCLAPCPHSVPVPSCLLLTCQSLPVSHSLLSSHTFTSQHSMDMRFTHCDQRVTALLGYSPGELQGRSVYELCHALDTHCLTKNHLNLCSKNQSVTGVYRMLVKGGGYIWVESHSAVLPRVRASRTTLSPAPPLCILCVNYVLSGVEEPSLQLSLDQTVCRHVNSKYTL